MIPETIPCTICGEPTVYFGTKLCDRCWELERRIQAAPELALKILRNEALKKKLQSQLVINRLG